MQGYQKREGYTTIQKFGVTLFSKEKQDIFSMEITLN